MWPIARVTFLEGIRSRLIFGVFLFSLLIIASSLVFVNLFMHNLAKIAVDFVLASVSLSGLLISFSLTISLISKDLQTKTIYFILSKPITRTAYIFGKFLGISLLTILVYTIISTLGSITLLLIEHYYPRSFRDFSWLAYLQAIHLDFIKISIFNALIIFLSTITSSAFITLLFAISLYIIGQSLSTVVEYLSLGETSIVSIPQSIGPLVTVFSFLLPNFSLFNTKLLAAHGIVISFSKIFLFSLYGVGYMSILLCLASYIFNKKELS